MARSSSPFRKPRETAAKRRGGNFRGTCKIPPTACLFCARGSLFPALSKELLLSRHDSRLTTPDENASFLGGDQRNLCSGGVDVDFGGECYFQESRDREGAVLFAASAEYRQSLFSLRGELWAGQGPSAAQRNPPSPNSGATLQERTQSDDP
jgi:hypothetical protein